MSQKKYVYVFGSKRKFQKLKDFFDLNIFNLLFISGAREDDFNITKTEKELFEEFSSLYTETQQVVAFISFGKGSIVNNIEAIANVFEKIKDNYKGCSSAQYIGPSGQGAKIFCNKYLTNKALEELNIPVPKTVEIYDLSHINIDGMKFPLVLKAENLSGGRGMKYVKDEIALQYALEHLTSLGINKLILSGYLEGVEVTFTVFRLGDNFMRLPASYKKETTEDMIHPDAKVKISGIFTEFEEYFKYVELVMKKYDIYGFFSLQGVLIKENNKYIITFLEAAPRLTGSTPIMEASLIGFNSMLLLSKWIADGTVFFAYQKRPAIQYSTYIHNGIQTVVELKKNEWILEAKYEDLGIISFSEEKRDRIRISFYLDNIDDLRKKADIISNICGNKNYTEEIVEVLNLFKDEHPYLYGDYKEKFLEGSWGEDTRWEFFITSHLPNTKLCSAVFGLPKMKNGLVLTRTKRGWELPGGHIEEGENIEETLQREVLEEAGFLVERAILVGYRKITTNKPLFDKSGKQYPFPVSYIPHFVVSSTRELQEYSGEEVLERKFVLSEEVFNSNSHVNEIIQTLLKEIYRIN